MKFKIPEGIVVCLFFIFCGGQTIQAAFELNTPVNSANFDDEIAPGDNSLVRAITGGTIVGYITNGCWVGYSNFNFGTGASEFEMEAATKKIGGTIELWINSQPVLDPLTSLFMLNGGTKIGSVAVTTTGSNTNFVSFSCTLSAPVSGIHNLYLKFISNNTGFIFDTRNFLFSSDTTPDPGPGLITNQVAGVYSNMDFGVEANYFSIDAATPGAGGKIDLRIVAPDGPLVGTVMIRHTGAWVHYMPFDCVLSETVSGIHDLYLLFTGSGDAGNYPFNMQNAAVRREVPALMLPVDSDEDSDGVPALLEYATGMHPQSRDVLPFNLDTTDPSGGFDLRVRADEGLTTKLLVTADLTNTSWQAVTFLHTNGTWQTDNAEITVGEVIPQGNDLYSLRLQNGRTEQALFARLAAETQEGRLHVYPPVLGLGMTPTQWATLPKDEWTESPYYTYGIQKVSALNSTNLAEVTNWETPFAFFTRCVDGSSSWIGYKKEFIANWSHTYCNFELDPHTPIVIKIHRRTQEEAALLNIDTEAPLGPITHAAAHPARKVDSCQLIDGEVYVTMSQPALLAVDIDGQMDLRDGPKAIDLVIGDPNFNELKNSRFPYLYESNATHAVSIFANPFIEDKPDINDTANVRVVQPGQLPPTSFSEPILYFAPGVHKFSVDTNGYEREWIESDALRPISGKSYYIPGDAIVYGNMTDGKDNILSENVRIFGHGTLSGQKIPHRTDFSYGDFTGDTDNLRMLLLDDAENCVFEGLTLANPPAHTVKFIADDRDYPPNYVKWCKELSWRDNNDGFTVQGNSYIEDCFIRHQDDGSYIRGMGIRRTVYWTDVVGTTFRGSFMTSDHSGTYPAALPQNLIIEDCDVIYARCCVVNGIDKKTRMGVIADWQSDNAVYSDGTTNTGQHIIFRNLTVEDPRPQRMLFAFLANFDTDTKTGDWAGMHFENINYMHPHTFGWPCTLIGDADTKIKYFTFKNVHINGQLLDAGLLANPAVFTTDFVSDIIFEP
jgi:hypothetical protein